jgi:superfamily II DNA or RNA helicase
MFQPGTRVRLKGDPGVVGTVTATPLKQLAGRVFIEIERGSGRRDSYPANQLEEVQSAPDASCDFRANKLSAPEDLRRAVTHLRMTGDLADMIYSLGATNTDFHAYQFKPVLKLLNAPARGLLVADEVGLGKTIEAGLIWTELVARFEARRLLVVCPKPLVQKWREELRNKFNVDARFCSAADLLDLVNEKQRPTDGFAAIASLAGIRPPKAWNDPDVPAEGHRAELARRLSDETQAELFDLVIFDEAHHLRNVETMSHKLGELLTGVADYSLLLSATPINLRANDLRALLKLIDPDTFEREWLFDVLQQENIPLVAAWEAARNPKVPLAKIAELVGQLREGQVLKTGARLERLREEFRLGMTDTPATRVQLAARLEEMSLLGSIVNRTRRRDVAEIKVVRQPATASWAMSNDERAFYDRASERIEFYALQHGINERFLLAQSQRLLASSLAAAYRHWGERSGSLSLDEEDEDTRPVPGPLVAALGEICDSHQELSALEAHDTKFELLFGTLKEFFKLNPDQKIIIFSSFRRTIDYLTWRLAERVVATMQLHGGIKEDRQATVGRFADAAGATVLLTSEVGGEGLDLQFCRALINWDLPWNPMKVEQRIGRIDRIGQTSPTIEIINLIAEKTIEEVVYQRLYVRLDIIKQTLGDFEPILGEIVRDMELLLANPELSPSQREAELDRAVQAVERRKHDAETLEKEAPGLIAHGDSILQRVQDSYAPHKMITPADLRDFIAGTLIGSFEGTRLTRVPELEIEAYTVRLSQRAQAEFARYREQHARRYPTRFSRDAATGVNVIFGRNPDPVRYRHLEAVPMTHPLARFASKQLENRQHGMAPRPATAFSIPQCDALGLQPGDYMLGLEKWSIKGVLPVDRLAFVGAAIVTGVAIDSETAERVLIGSLACHPALLTVDDDTIDRGAVALEGVVLPALSDAREMFEQGEAARHYDLAETQRALILENRARRQRQAESRITELRLRGGDGRMRIVLLEQRKLEKFLARIDIKLDEIGQRERAFSVAEPILIGVALVRVRGG